MNANGKRRITTHQDAATMKKSLSKNSESSSQFESPIPFDSPNPMRWDGTDPPESEYQSTENSPGKLVENPLAIVKLDMLKHVSSNKRAERQKPPENAPSAMMMYTGSAAEEPPQRPPVKLGAAIGGGERRSRSAEGGWKTEEVVSKAALGFRLSEVAVCLISFSVMAADKTQGWSGDSFDRYREYRYCLSVNVIGFAYSALQACDLACQLATGKHFISHHLRYHFDFFLDQVLAYLLISASSCAATRVDDWQSNWGKDEFTEMATASIGLSFLAFIAFAMSSLISGYILCNRSSM